MINLDKIKQKKDELRAQLAEALREADDKKIGEAMDGFMSFMSDTIMAEASGMGEAADRSVLAARGVRQLTAKETEFYNDFISRAKAAGDPQTVITNIGSALPETVIDSVMDDMRTAYPLLNLIDFTNTGAAIKWVLNGQGAQAATWDELNTEITLVPMTVATANAVIVAATAMIRIHRALLFTRTGVLVAESSPSKM